MNEDRAIGIWLAITIGLIASGILLAAMSVVIEVGLSKTECAPGPCVDGEGNSNLEGMMCNVCKSIPSNSKAPGIMALIGLCSFGLGVIVGMAGSCKINYSRMKKKNGN